MSFKKYIFTVNYETMSKALATLGNALDYYQTNRQNPEKTVNLPDPEGLQLILEDSCIQRFKYCSSMIWRYTKNFLKTKHGIPGINSPKNIVHHSTSIGLLTEKQARSAIAMIECRKKIFDMYAHGMVQKILDQIPEYYELMKTILEKMKP